MMSENLHFLFTFYIATKSQCINFTNKRKIFHNVLFSFIFVVFKGLG